MTDISDLYHPLIIKHNRTPRNFFEPPSFGGMIHAYNPLCGDEFKIFLSLTHQTITEVAFHGYGCAVSKAAISIWLEKVKGADMFTAIGLIELYLSALQQKNTLDDPELSPFLIAEKYPGRVQCAKLGAEAIHQFLKDKLEAK